MSEILISHSPDLAKLEAEGFRLRVIHGDANHLLIEGIPSVTTEKKVVIGTLYSPLELDAEKKIANPLQNHQCWWIGSEAPCDANGNVMQEMISNPGAEPKGDGITTTVGFSRKRADKSPYKDYHEKIWAYVELIWHEAQAIDPKCDPRGERPIPAVVAASRRSFSYPDMATTLAGIGAVTAKLVCERIAIVGLGGTGSYILDLLAKTPIGEIHIFDGDVFKLQNAFRAPGAPTKADVKGVPKVDWFGDIYGRMHLGINRHGYHIVDTNVHELSGFDFVFVAIDDGEARKLILNSLIAANIPFIDVGMDLDIDKTISLRGQCRITLGTAGAYEHVKEVVSYAKAPDNDLYRNIQVADMNMLNAAMAVMKWKKLRGFYADDVLEHHSVYTTSSHALSKEDRA